MTLLFAVACGAAATATPVPKPAAAPEAPKAPAAAAPAATAVPTAVPTAAPRPTPAPVVAPKAKLDRLRLAMPPVGSFDTNFTWPVSRGGLLDKRPALEFLIGTDPNTSAYIPELAEKWEMGTDGKTWTITLRKGIKFIDSERDWGEFTATDVRHALFLVTQPESVITDAGLWRAQTGITTKDAAEEAARKLETSVEIVDPHKVVFRLKSAAPELFSNLSGDADLMIQSKARWDAGGKELQKKKVVGTGPFAMIERKEGVGVLYRRVENHWRKTPEYREFEFVWAVEASTRLATLLAGEVHISSVDRSIQKEAVAKGMKVITSKLPGLPYIWSFGGLYFVNPDKLDPNVPFVKKEVRQAMNMAINRKGIADSLLGGKARPIRVNGYHPQLDNVLWPGVWNPQWDEKFDQLYGYNPVKAKALLEQAGYPNGFEFTIYRYPLSGVPENGDIAEAMVLDFKAVGLKPKLVETEYATIRPSLGAQSMHSTLWANLPALRTLEFVRVFNTKGSVVNSYQNPFIQERMEALGKVTVPVERTRILREIGDHKFNEFAEIPMFWMFGEATVNPKFIADYPFPGTIVGSFSHLEYIKPAQ